MRSCHGRLSTLSQRLITLFRGQVRLSRSVNGCGQTRSLPVFSRDQRRHMIRRGLARLGDRRFTIRARRFLSAVVSLSGRIRGSVQTTTGSCRRVFTVRRPGRRTRVNCFKRAKSFYRRTVLSCFGRTPISPGGCRAFRSLFVNVRGKRVSCNILPIRGSSANTVSRILSLLCGCKLSVINRRCIGVRRRLVNLRRADLSRVRRICSRPRNFRRSASCFGSRRR